jgi:isopenicillin N synthase-like dioxygenase
MSEVLVPVIDLSQRRGGDAARARIATEVGHACETSGFLTVINHGVEADLIGRMDQITRAFFALPEQEKDRWVASNGIRGFRRFGGYVSASIGVETLPDLCQMFSMLRFGEPGVADGVNLGDQREELTRPNIWPDRPEGMRQTWLAYYRAMEDLAADLMRLFALALALPERFFDNKIDQHMTGMTANFYYPWSDPLPPGQYRKGPHTDWGSLTILYQDSAGGLQVQDDGGRWHEVAAVPGALVINLGDLMAEWTQHRWISTMHQVTPPSGDAGPRISIAFFHQPNFDAVIEPLWPSRDTSARSTETVTSGGWIARKMAAAYGSTADSPS